MTSPGPAPRRLVAVAAVGPLLGLGLCYWLGLYAAHNVDARKGVGPTGLAFAEAFLWIGAAGLGVGVLLVLAVLLLVRRTRTTPPLLATWLSGAVALAGLAFSAMARPVVTDWEFVRPRSAEWAAPFVTAGAVAALVPLVVAALWWAASRSTGRAAPG